MQPDFIWMRGRQVDERHRKETKNRESGCEDLTTELEGVRGTMAQWHPGMSLAFPGNWLSLLQLLIASTAPFSFRQGLK